MSLYYQNVRGLRSKTQKFLLASHASDFDVIVLTETWLSSTFLNNELFSTDFVVYRKDRYSDPLATVGGGIIIAVRSVFHSCIFPIPNTDSVDIICVKVRFGNKFLFIINMYIPPKSPLEIYNIASNAINYVSDNCDPLDDILLAGDFNLPDLEWTLSDDETCLMATNVSSPQEVLFVDNVISCDLQQVSCIKNNISRQLDLIFVTNPSNCVVELCPIPMTKVDSYHPPLSVLISHAQIIDSDFDSGSLEFDFKKTNFLLLNELIQNIDFDTLLSGCIEVMVSNFYLSIFDCFIASVPVKKSRHLAQTTPPWYTHQLRSLRNLRNRAWKKYLISNKLDDYNSYISLYEEFQSLCRILYDSYLLKMRSSLLIDPKLFWKFVNSKKKSDGYPSTMKYLDVTSNSPLVICNMFSSFFKLSFCDDDFEPCESNFTHLNSFTQSSMSDVVITVEDVLNHLLCLDNDLSSGPDGIPAFILKNCCKSLARPLTFLFQNSLKQAVFPKIWKNSFIIPIHKKGTRGDISNYRPIAKLSCIPKLFEAIIFKSFYFSCKPFLAIEQHGFMKKKSTVTNLLEFTSFTNKTIENGHQVDCIYTDFSKAFDKLSHSLILFKLSSLGFPSAFVQWIRSYLKGRTYQVLFRGIVSDSINADSGVPQGSHLGPLLFIVSINDVVSIVKSCRVLIYADDIKLFKIIKNESDSVSLQNDINVFSEWCSYNNLFLNVSKCQAMSFFRKKNPTCYNYSINQLILSKVETTCDLGVHFSQNLDFSLHIEKIVSKANSMLGFIKRWSKEFSCSLVTSSLYNTFVRPQLEYASTVWSPHYSIHVDRIESVQRKYVRFALSHLNWNDPNHLPPYCNRLLLLNMTSLEKRRKVTDVMFLHQLLVGSIDSPVLLEQVRFKARSHSSRNSEMFHIDFHRTNYGQNEPLTRMKHEANLNHEVFDLSYSKLTLKHKLYGRS